MLIYILNRKKESFYKFLFFVHLFFGIFSFCFLLIDQIKSCDDKNLNEIRPKEFYEYKIGYILIILNSSSCFFRFISYFFFFFIIKYTNELNSWESKFTSLSNLNKTNISDIFKNKKDKYKDKDKNNNDNYIINNSNRTNQNDEYYNILKENLNLSISPYSNENIDLSGRDSEKIRYDANFLERNIKNKTIFNK